MPEPARIGTCESAQFAISQFRRDFLEQKFAFFKIEQAVIFSDMFQYRPEGCPFANQFASQCAFGNTKSGRGGSQTQTGFVEQGLQIVVAQVGNDFPLGITRPSSR
ncbi:hypothetical protein [Parasphingorhabdus sp.]|uniref:hypothetical protein n=1 Tax=Parasphingorhabdus sp. TaxID=2709688 RepID=UPI0032655B12